MRARYPLNVVGDFYVESDCCTQCGVPHFEAPGLLAEPSDEVPHCYVIRQPQNLEQLDETIRAMCVAEFDCIRYGGRDTVVLLRIVDKGRASGFVDIFERCCDASDEGKKISDFAGGNAITDEAFDEPPELLE